MVKFINIKAKDSFDLKNYKHITNKLNVEQFDRLINNSDHLCLDNFDTQIKITNKGGLRMINYIKKLISISQKDIVVIYNPIYIFYLMTEKPQVLFNYSGNYKSPIIIKLISEDIESYIVKNNDLFPESFIGDGFVKYINNEYPELTLELLTDIKIAKSKHEDLKMKDLKQFDDAVPSLKMLSSQSGYSEEFIVNQLSNYSI